MELSQLSMILKIIGGVIALLNFIGIIFIYFVNKAAFKKIITNDLRHVNQSLEKICEEQTYIKDRVFELSGEVSYIKGKYDAKIGSPKPIRRTRRKASVKLGVKKKRVKK